MQFKTPITIGILSLGLVFGGTAVAQDYQAQEQQQPQSVDVTDRDLEQFAEAEQGVREVQETYSERLQSIDDPQEQQELQQKANEEMRAAVTDAGLDVQTYNEISMAIQQDPELRQRYDELQQS